MSEWQPIETAPRTGEKIIATGLDYGKGPDRHVHVVQWYKRGFRSEHLPMTTFQLRLKPTEYFSDGDEDSVMTSMLPFLTHWMPLPAPPEVK